MAVALTIVVVVGLTIAFLIVSGWRRGRPALPGISGDTAGEPPAPDVWHGDPHDDDVGRPAGADAEAMAPPSDRSLRHRRRDTG